jgi:hypothetical protein
MGFYLRIMMGHGSSVVVRTKLKLADQGTGGFILGKGKIYLRES